MKFFDNWIPAFAGTTPKKNALENRRTNKKSEIATLYWPVIQKNYLKLKDRFDDPS